jgi:hypothetical protein
MPIPNSQVPGFFCSDQQVQDFCERELRNFNPYAHHMSARELFEAARRRYSDYRCWDLEIWPH